MTRARILAGLAALSLLAACGDGASGPASREDSPVVPAAPTASPAQAHPAPPYSLRRGGTLPDLAFDGIDQEGRARAIGLHESFAPSAASSRLLVIRVHGGAWCGTCRWHAAHTAELDGIASRERISLLDVVLGNRDAAPADAADAAGFRALIDTPERGAVVVDPGASMLALAEGKGVILPLVALVDARTMVVRDLVSNPDPEDLAHRIRTELARLEGAPVPERPAETLVDGVFHRNEWDLVRDVTLPGAPPADPTNAVADEPAAAALGKALFEDAGLSPSGAVACATCHDPKTQLSDARPIAVGVAEGTRRTPRIALAAFSRWQGWDGKADTLWAQALGPLESEVEMASSRVFVARRIATVHAAGYAAAFPGIALPDASSLPLSGKPGEPAFDALSPAAQDAVTRTFVNVGKALAAYERRFRVAPNALDAYVGGDADALAPLEKLGLSTFVQVGCMQCHWGPRLTDDAFHVTRVGGAPGAPDRGRLDGIAKARGAEFAAWSRWSDAPAARSAAGLREHPSMLGAFKTPALRGVAKGAPFGHAGALGGLVDVTEGYGKGGDPHALGVVEPWVLPFGETTQWALVPFLAVLTGEPQVGAL